MKNIKIFLLGITIWSFAAQAQPTKLDPSNCVIVSDIDSVILKNNFFLRCAAQLKHVVGHKKTDAVTNRKSLVDKRGNSISGMTFQLLYHGMTKSFLAKYVPSLLERLEKSRKIIEGTEKIYQYLKNVKGYPIAFATNKDRIAYDISAEAQGLLFTNLADYVFVAHPGNSPELINQIQSFANLWDTPDSYKQLMEKALTIQPTPTIFHAPGRKPHVEYFEYVENQIGSDKNIIFIDDIAENVAGFHQLQSHKKGLRHGIIFKDPQQLAEEFIALGILSEIEDKELLDEIRYTSLFGKMRSKKRKAVKKLHAIAEVIRN